MTFWKTNFNMPVPCLFNGSSDCSTGFLSARYCDMGWSSQSLAGFYPGYEVALADGLWRWEVSEGSCLSGIACNTITWYRGATCIGKGGWLVCVSLTSCPGWCSYSWYEGMQNVGVASWEIACSTTYCTVVQATCYSGNDVSIPACTTCLDFGCVPSVGQCSSSLMGHIWVGTDSNLHYINANCFEHVICGDNQGATIGSPGALWIGGIGDNFLHWIGCDGNDYKAPWAICQFCSTFSNGAPANPSPGAGYAGNIWVDNLFGDTHLAYIAIDGNKYLTGAGNCPYIAP